MAAPAITLTQDQQNALDALFEFITDPVEKVFVLSGYSGCGKSTLVQTFLDKLPEFLRTIRLIDPNYTPYDLELTATTNTAAENLGQITGQTVRTIHSYLGLRVVTDYKTGDSKLIPRKYEKKNGALIFIDESSFVDKTLLQYIFELTENCKIVFIGDPAQLRPVKATGSPVFDAGFKGATLKEVVRQPKKEGKPGELAEVHPIVALATKFRETVISGEFFNFKPDGHHVVHLHRDDFNDAVLNEFTRPDWHFRDSKVLAWTNKQVIAYNQFVRQHAKGDPQLQVGDYALVNSAIMSSKGMLKTDQRVQITAIGGEITVHGVQGHMVTVNGTSTHFMPLFLAAKNTRLKQAREEDEYSVAREITDEWIDLRASYASTIDKAQGSTCDQVYIDLDDISKCNSGDQIARLLYVGVSRARNRVFLTGDLA
jgi:hypothetical protein